MGVSDGCRQWSGGGELLGDNLAGLPLVRVLAFPFLPVEPAADGRESIGVYLGPKDAHVEEVGVGLQALEGRAAPEDPSDGRR
jgi:hypothetical protein